MDGIDNNDKSLTGRKWYISPEVVTEFSLLANQYSAEFARSTGGQFITVTKSGSNDFHGTAYSFFQNRHLNALDTLQKTSGITRCTTLGNDLCLPRSDTGRFGGNVGGPLILPRFGTGGPSVWNGKNRLFFFVSCERLQNGNAAGAGAIDAPTATGMAALDRIPGLSTTNLAIFKQYVPTAPAQRGKDVITVNGVNIPVGNVNIPSPNYFYQNNLVTNFDFTQSEKTQHRVRYIKNQLRLIDTAATLPVFYLLKPDDAHLFAYTLTHTFSSKVNYEMRVGYRRRYTVTPAGDFKYPGLDQFPNIGLGELGINIGPDGNAPQFTIENNYQLVNNLSYLVGNHSMKFGGDLRKVISPQSFVQRQRGDYLYNNVETFLRDLSPEFAERSVGTSAYYGDQKLAFLFAQDDWRVRPNLTLNLGVNYSWQQLPYGARQQKVNALASVPGVITFGEPQAQKKNFGPRIGLAYSPNHTGGLRGLLFGSNGQSSIRAGFSLAYDVIFDNLYILTLPPQSNQTVNADPGLANFLKNGGIPPTPVAVGSNPALARAATAAYIPDQQVPYAISYTLSYQRQFHQNWSAELRYLGTRGVHLPTQNRLNVQNRITDTSFLPTYFTAPTQAQIDALPLTLATVQARSRFVPSFEAAGFNANNVITFLPNGNSTYHGFSSQLNRRFSQGLMLSAAYTWSHMIDDTTAEVFSTVLSPRRVQDFRNLRAERANSALDHRHRFSLSGVYDLPFFTKSSNRFVRTTLGGFSFAGTLSLESGEFATVRSGIDSNLNGDNAGDRTILNPNGAKGTGSTVTALLKSCPTPCSLTAAQRTVGYVASDPNAQYIQAGLGARATAGRNTLLLPGIQNLDFSAFKNFQMTETVKLQVRADFFNLLNTPKFVPGSVNGVEPTAQVSDAATSLVTIGLNRALFNRTCPDLVFSSHPRATFSLHCA
ncbi:MAG: carboxypeptidase regulatory-like domain-containing protein [Blastocatellia bacterium]